VIKKEAEKILKYKAFITEIQHMRNVKAKVIPLLTRATATISKITQTIPEQHTGKARN